MPRLVEEGVSALNMGVVQGHRPVAHHHPFLEAVPLAQKVVIFHAGVGVQILQPVLPGDAAVDEDEIPRLQDVRKGEQELGLPGVVVQQGGAQGGQVGGALGHGVAQLQPHLQQGGALPPIVEDGPKRLVHAGAAL